MNTAIQIVGALALLGLVSFCGIVILHGLRITMKTILQVAGSLALLALATLCGILAFESWHIGHQVQLAVGSGQTAADRLTAVLGEPSRAPGGATISQVLFAARGALAGVESTARGIPGESAAWRAGILEELARYRGEVHTVAAASAGALNQAEATAARFAELPASVRPVFASTDELLQQSSSTVAMMRPQALGLVAAGKVTLGEWAQLSRRIDASAPQFIGDFGLFTRHVAGMAADGHSLTSKFTAPRSTKAKIWDGIKTAVFMASRFTPW